MQKIEITIYERDHQRRPYGNYHTRVEIRITTNNGGKPNDTWFKRVFKANVHEFAAKEVSINPFHHVLTEFMRIDDNTVIIETERYYDD